MIFYYMILLFLSWPRTRCTEDVNLKEKIFDQLAIASENVAHAVRHSNASSKNFQKQLSSSRSATVRYENSNGFVPMVPSATPSYDDLESSPLRIDDLEQDDRFEERNTTNAVSARDSPDTKQKGFEEDLAYSSEARIFLNLPGPLTNRRSFDFQERPNEFELLKINNDTPAVANYQDFYENLHSTVNTETDGELDTSSRHLRGKKEKRIENGYARPTYHSHQTNDEDPYDQYYLYNNVQDTKKTTYEQEKVTGNYRQQNTVNYNGHGQSAARQNAPTAPSSSRTNYEVNELAHGASHDESYDNTAEQSKTRHRFSKPVVVAEPSNYKVDMKFSNRLQISGLDNDKTSRNLESSSSETSSQYESYNDNNNRQRSYHRIEDSKNSDESMEYSESEYEQRAKRLQKNRRRPSYSDSSRKFPKEHRGLSNDNVEEEDKYKLPKLKSQRFRVKANPWTNDANINYHDESIEDINSSTEVKSTKVQPRSRPRYTNRWNQITPNLEISHSNGIELDQVEKPKYVVPVKVNLVPVANFDHATALDNSQGFDVSNAMLQNFVTASPIGAFTTSTPILSTPQSVFTQNLGLSKNLANVNLGVSTSVPDIIVGQNSFQNPVQTVLLSQSNRQNKIADTMKTAYLPSTITPVFTLTSSLTPTLQTLPLQNVQSNVTPRTAFAVTSTPTPVIQHIPINHMHTGMQQLLMPQPTIQTFSSFLQPPLQTNSEYQIQMNPHAIQGQNLINHGNLQVQSLPTTPTLMSGQAISEGRINAESENKKDAYTTASTNFLASASLAVGQNGQKQATNSYYLQNHNPQQVMKPQEGVYQLIKDADTTSKTKNFIQATQVFPTLLHPHPTLSGITTQQLIPTQQNLQNTNFILQRPRDQTQQYIKLQSNGADDAMQQLQIQMNRMQLMKNNRIPGVILQTADSATSHSNNINSVNTLGASSTSAHLPNVGTKNVEIVNPNIKPSPVDTTINTFESMHYPAAVMTTPTPIFNTISPVTPQTVSLQNYMDTLTQAGSKSKQLGTSDLKMSQNQERPMFDPINFVPNVDIIKNQNALNNKLPSNEPLQQGLDLVPVMPGGNFFKPSLAAQSELVMKPKLASDLQKYAEEMFKESLKTMYNSQKWNNDRNPHKNNPNNSEASDLAKLRTELQKLRATITESKYKDLLEAHQSETRLRSTDAPTSLSSGKKKPNPLVTTLEHLLKKEPGPIHIYHGNNRPSHKHKLEISNFDSGHDDFDSDAHLMGFLSPPRPNHFRSKRPFHEKPKKRPAALRFKNGRRKPGRPNNSPRSSNELEASSSNINVHLDDYHSSPFDGDKDDFGSGHSLPFDTYPTFTTSAPEVFNMLQQFRTSNKDYNINHPRMHNLLGLMMKNKQLPTRSTQQTLFRDKDQLRQYFENEKHQEFYDDALKDYFEDASQPGSIAGRKVYSGNGGA